MILAFDTETTGLPVNDNRDWSTCRLIQLAWIIVNESSGELVKSASYLVRDPTIKSNDEALNCHHITEELREQKGIELPLILNEFILDASKCNLLVFHSGIFDLGVILNEAIIYNISLHALENLRTFNTKTTDKYLSNKPWNLVDCVKHFDPDYVPPCGLNAHDALYDTYLCYHLYEISGPEKRFRKFGDSMNYIYEIRTGKRTIRLCGA